MVGLLRRDDRGIGGQHEVDARVRDKVGLELRDVHVQGSIETQRCRQAGDDLSDEAVQVRVRGTLDVQVPEREIIHSTGIRTVVMQAIFDFLPCACGRCHRALHCRT